MKMTFEKPNRADFVNPSVLSNRRENHFRNQWSLVDLNDGREILTARWYGNGAVSYCCVWARFNGEFTNGGARAGGYGYHKDSASFEHAMRDAGFSFSDGISGVGDSAIESAMQSFAAACGLKSRFVIIRAHG